MKNKSIKITALLVLIAMSLTSCLNDLEDFLGDFGGSPAVAEFNEAVNASTGYVVREIIDPNAPVDFKLKLNIASAYPLNTDVVITLAIDTNMITAYNAKMGYTNQSNMAKPIPEAAISYSGLTVTIPAGEREAEWTFTVDALQVPNPVSTFYIFPVKITNATGGAIISGNFGTRLVRIIGRNKYDGVYTNNGTMVDVVVPTITGNYPTEIQLVTSGNTQVIFNDPAAAPWGTTIYHTIRSGGSLSVYGSFGLIVNFDGTTNSVTSVINYYGQPAGNTRSAELDPSGVNQWDPTTRNVQIKYFMKQPSSVPTAPNIRTTFDETWTFISARD